MTAQEWRDMMTVLLDSQESGYNRSRAFARFLQTEAHLAHLELVGNLLTDANQTFRHEAVRQVVRNIREEYYPILAATLDSGDTHIVREALRGLEGCHDPAIIQHVTKLVQAGDSSLRYEAERVIKKMQDGANPWEQLIKDTRQPVIPTCQPASVGFTKQKTEEVRLTLNMLPTDTPYPIHRSSRHKHHGRVLNQSLAAADVESNGTEVVLAALISVVALLLVLGLFALG